MKKFILKSFAIVLLLGLTSCQKWLGENIDPNYPTNAVATPEIRLPWIQHHYCYGYGSASVRAGMITGMLSTTTFSGTNGTLPAWNPAIAATTTPYQQWFVGSACNINDLILAAEKQQAYHYIGAAYTIHAMGFMLMVDWYGEMPYTEALGSSLSPKYDNGKTIFEGCLQMLDKALENFNKVQPATAVPLSKGDSWNGGDVQKWKKLVYGLKARWLNNLSKKSSYNPTAILDAIAQAPQSNAEGTVINHVNDLSDVVGDVLFGDPLKTSYAFDSGAWSDWARFTQWYVDLLENTYTGGSGVVDPRADKLLPSAQHYINGQSVFIRTKGVDAMRSDIRLKNGPMVMYYNVATKKYAINTTNPARLGDTVYVGIKALCALNGATTTESAWTATDGTILSTGTFYTRPESPTDILTYHEMCFIKAEIYFRQGKKAEALQAYRDGIRAHMMHMNAKLASYGNTTNPGKRPMSQTDIDNFMNSAAVAQNINEISMAKIMQQKYIAMSFTQQNWNDMRRFNFSAGNIGNFGVVYTDFERPYEFNSTSATKITGTSKTQDNYWFRRMSQCSHEVNYNSANMRESNPKAFDLDIWSVPVWWDIAE